jgi:ligand-binding SRPBCC domain-containing protein
MVTLEELTLIDAPVTRCFDLARSVEVHLAGNVHWGDEAVATAGVTSGLLGMGQRVTFRARHFALRHHLTSEITAFDPPAHFQDTMIDGPFRSLQHDHFFRAIAGGQTEMRDLFRFAAPPPVLGRLAETLFLCRYMRTLLLERSAVIRQVAESDDWQRYLP